MTEDRAKFIGSSEIAAVMGLSRWKTPLALWAEKRGKLKNDPLANFEAKEWGMILEEVVARKFSQKTGLKVRNEQRRYTHPRHEYLTCLVDRIILNSDELLECKTAGAWMAKHWDGEDIPREYILQVNFQLGLTKRVKGHIACLIGGNKFLMREVLFDAELFDEQVRASVVFWEEFVLKDVPPVAVGEDLDILASLYPEKQDSFFRIDGVEGKLLDELLIKRNALKKDIAKLESEEAQIDARIKQRCGEYKGFLTEGYRVAWATVIQRRVDTERLKIAGLYETYTNSTTTRRLNVKTAEAANGASA